MVNVLRITLLGPNQLISSNKLLNESFVSNFQELQNTFRRNGLLLLAFSPFFACYVIIKAFVGNADTLRRDPAALTSRCWSLRARWQFRECSPISTPRSSCNLHRTTASHARARVHRA